MGKQIVFTKQANDFIFSQPIPAVTKILETIDALGKCGALGMPNAKKIDKSFSRSASGIPATSTACSTAMPSATSSTFSTVS